MSPSETSAPPPPAPARTVWRPSFLAVKSHFAKDLFFFGERGRTGAKDVLLKYPPFRAVEGSNQKLKLPWIDFSPLFTSSHKYLAFPGHVCSISASERWLCFCLRAVLRGAPRSRPLAGQHLPAVQTPPQWDRARSRLCQFHQPEFQLRARMRPSTPLPVQGLRPCQSPAPVILKFLALLARAAPSPAHHFIFSLLAQPVLPA